VIGLDRSPDDGGFVITDYDLQIDGGSFGSAFKKASSYNYNVNGFSFTASASVLNLDAGKLYRFRFRALNYLGYSEFSDSLIVGLGSLPS